MLDEPNAHLDAEGEQALVETVVRMRERGTTIVLIAQRAGIMVQMDKMAVLQAGSIVLFGPREEVLRKLRSPAVPVSPPRAVSAPGEAPRLQKPT